MERPETLSPPRPVPRTNQQAAQNRGKAAESVIMPIFQSIPENVTACVCRRTCLEDLADVLIADLSADIRSRAASRTHDADDSAEGMFYRPEVIVPNKSMRRYLTMRFARNEGITAGIRFPSLMSLFSAERINAGSIAWRIYRILLSDSGRRFRIPCQWIRGDAKRCYDLANRLGRPYDRYMLYRPDWLNAWERNAVPEELRGMKDADWQGELWREAAKDWAGRHFAAEYARIIRGGTDGRHRTIRIFGFSQLAPAMMECLAWLNSTGNADVKLYQPAPSSGKYFGENNLNLKEELKELVHLYYHTGEDPERLEYLMSELFFRHNPLIAAFGAQSRTAMTEAEELNFIGADYDGEAADAPSCGSGSILHRLQRKIMDDEPESAVPAKALKSQADACPSVQIRSCYSAFREVEAAHNFILHCLDEDPELTLNDVFIMTPTPDVFSPLVDAVFNHADEGRLAVSLADRPETDELPSYRTFLKILSLFKGEFTASDIFGILEDAAVQAQTGITADDCREFRDAAGRAGIRWGWDADDHRNGNSGGRAFPQNTWQAGFDRMLLHYAVDLDPAAPFPADASGGEDALYAVPGYSGSRAVTLGKIAVLVRRLHDFALMMRARSRDGVPFRVWKETLMRAAAEFFGADSELPALLLNILSNWGTAISEAQARTDAESGGETDPAGYETDDTPLNGETVLAHLGNQVSDSGDSTRGFMRGSITFCGLRPMRSIPADAIVLLGMNHRAFPGEDNAPEFDLMRKTRKAGDPDKREESRQLFLDVIMAARKYLYISYTGRDNHDRKEYPPSVCVDVLRSYLEHEFGKNSFVDLQEPIQAFSPELFKPQARNQSYSGKLLEAAKKIRSERTQDALPVFHMNSISQPPDASLLHISMDDLIRFLGNPATEFVKKRLDASASVTEETPAEDSEVFEGKQDFDRTRELLELYLRTRPEQRSGLARISLQRLKADGAVPLTETPETWGDWKKIAALGENILAESGGGETLPLPQTEKTFACGVTLTLPEQDLPVSSGGIRLQLIPDIGNSISAHTLIRGILNHLGANLREKTATRILYVKDGAIHVSEAEAMEPDKAERAMNGILELYCEGMTKPVPFFPKTICAMFRNENHMLAWRGTHQYKGEVEKFGMYFGDELPPEQELERLMRIVFGNPDVQFAERGSTG